MKVRKLSKRAVLEELRESFDTNGYVRFQNPERCETDGPKKYKKGHECRLVADSPEELERLQELVAAAGFRAGAPFKKGHQFVLPMYGCVQVLDFLEYLGIDDYYDL